MPRRYVRTMIVAVSGGAIIALGAAPVVAAPDNPNFPLGGQSQSEHEPQSEKPESAEKAEKLGGGVASNIIDLGEGVATKMVETGNGATTKIIEMGAQVVKCGLNIVAPSVKCD